MLINRGGIVNKKELEKLISTLKIEKPTAVPYRAAVDFTS